MNEIEEYNDNLKGNMATYGPSKSYLGIYKLKKSHELERGLRKSGWKEEREGKNYEIIV